MSRTIHITHYSRYGLELVLGSYEGKLCLCDWPYNERHHQMVLQQLRKQLSAEITQDSEQTTNEVLAQASRELDEYLGGKRMAFSLPIIMTGTDMQCLVWRVLLGIGYGKTLSYKELAERIGRPKAVRAVANAVGANALGIIIPCHRIIGADGSLTGFAGGIKTKQFLLDLERRTSQSMTNDNITMTDIAIPEGISLHIKTFEQLTLDELYSLLHIRSEVFIMEQDCVYQDLDYQDQQAIHIWLTQQDKTVAMCRICPKGTKMQDVSIGRVITTERGKGYGALIMRIALRQAWQYFDDIDHIDIEAQLTKKHFYEKLGFVATSEPFMLEGLMHLDMRLMRPEQ